MTLAITHTFVSAKGDGTDATLVRPSNWNASHTTSMANNALLGNVSGGTAAIAELPTTAFMMAALNAPDAATFLANLGVGAFTTGDAKYSINPTAAAGWIVYQGGTGTIGDASSSATVRANTDCSALFQMIWNQISSPSANAFCPVGGGLGASAAADWAAHKQITLPWFSGRGMVGAGGGGGLTTRVLGNYSGEETHMLTVGELASHYHSAAIYDPTHYHNVSGGAGANTFYGATTGNIYNYYSGGAQGSPLSIMSIASAATGNRVWDGVTLDRTYLQGSSTPHNNMQPYNVMWTHLKL